MTAARAAALLGVLLVVAAGCRSPWRRELAWEGRQAFLYREHREEDGERVALGLEHPADIEPEAVRFVLTRLVHEHDPLLAAPREGRVFAPGEVERLAEPLALSLATVTPDQRVRFLVVRSSLLSPLAGLTGISGVAFHDEGALHLAFDTIAEGIHQGDGRPEDVSFPYDPTAETWDHGLVPPFEGARLHTDPETGEVHVRWLEVDREALAAALREARDRDATETADAGSTGREPEDDATPGRAEADPGASGSDAPGEAASPSGDRDATASSPEGPPREEEATDPELESARRKLERLKRLRESGALTEEEYQRALDEVLEGL